MEKSECSSLTPETVIANLKENRVIPDVISFSDGSVCSVKFPSNHSVQMGNIILKTDASETPKINWDANDGDAMYTVMMVDHDAPSRKATNGEILHWLVINIKGLNIETGERMAPYRGPNPPENSGKHRYCFLIFKQNSQLSGVKQFTSREDLRHFDNAMTFATEHNLGNPIAVNYFFSMY